MTIMDVFEARGVKRGLLIATARGIIGTGRRHAFSDEIIIEDIAALTGCSFQDAEKILYDYDHMYK